MKKFITVLIVCVILTATFAGIGVEKIEKGSFGSYEIEMVNDAELKFSKEGMLKSCSF